MSERTSSKPGIADYVVARRKRKECFLDEIDRLIDWNPLEKILRKTLKRVVNAVGNPAYPPLADCDPRDIHIVGRVVWGGRRFRCRPILFAG